jgi:hypothetical protein
MIRHCGIGAPQRGYAIGSGAAHRICGAPDDGSNLGV